MSSSTEFSPSSPRDGDSQQRLWMGRKARTTTTTRGGDRTVTLVVILVLYGDLAGVLAQPSHARFQVGGNSVVRADKDTTLFCNLVDREADLPASYDWVKDGKVIPGEHNIYISLSKVTRQDGGYYQCGTPDSNIYGQGIQLQVYVPGDMIAKPVIHSQDVPVVGRPFSLHCFFLESYIPNGDTVYTWYQDSREVKGQTGEILRFPSVTETDKGEYTCTGREGHVGTTSPPSFPVDVMPLVPPQVRIKPPGSVVKGVRGHNLTLTCEVTRAFPGMPDDGYSWSYLPSPKGPQRPLEGKASTLTLGPLTLEDRGQYMCQARNDQLYGHMNLNLTGHTSVTVDIVYLENLTLTPDLEVNQGDRVTLTCGVDSRPTALLAWTVHGQEVRHVTDNLDHYVISRAVCSDSTSYTCRASNTELPGMESHATVQLHVQCKRVPTSDITETEVGAIFHFPLPDWTPMVVVHPGGHDVISVRQDGSYNVSSAFQSRCLQPWCDVIRHRLSFTLTNVTEEDEGEYVCLEEGTQRSPIPDCSKRLRVKKFVVEPSQTDISSSSIIALATCVSLLVLLLGILSGIFLGTKHYRLVRNLCHQLQNFMRTKSRHTEGMYLLGMEKEPLSDGAGGGNGEGDGPINKDCNFEGLYDKGKVYIFPPLVPPKGRTTSESEGDTEDETKPLLPPPDRKPSAEQEEFDVKNLLRYTLQNSKSTRAEDLPSFILHNTRLSQQEHVVLVLDKKLGVVVMIVNTASSLKDLHSAEEAVRHLVEARATVRRKLQGLVTSGSVQAVLCLPCMTHNEADELRQHLKVLRSHPDVELLAGQDPEDFRQWVERQGTARDRKLWESSSEEGDSPDTFYKKVVSKFLTLDGMDPPRDSHDSPDPVESLLLTPAQVEVRDSTARLLHIWGPPGSGKTTLLVHRARQWLAEGKALVLAVGREFYDIRLAQIEKAVRRGQGKETCSKIRICRTLQEIMRTGNDLRGKYPKADVCVIVDVLSEPCFLKLLLRDVRSGNLTNIWSAGWKNLSSVKDLSTELNALGWENIHLPDCIRCTDNTVELLNRLGHGVFPLIPSCSVPRVQDIPAWRVVDHCLHPDHTSTLSSCGHCKEEMSIALPSMEQDLQWNNWIALCTGNLEVSVDCKPVQEALLSFGVPVSYDSNTYLRQEDILSKSASCQDASATDEKKDFACFRERVMDGVDEKGRPTVHLVRVEDFKGMEREVVIMVHWDERDDPRYQGQVDSRLKEHTRQWIQAVSRSTGQVILLLLSPSPARSLLGLEEAVMP